MLALLCSFFVCLPAVPALVHWRERNPLRGALLPAGVLFLCAAATSVRIVILRLSQPGVLPGADDLVFWGPIEVITDLIVATMIIVPTSLAAAGVAWSVRRDLGAGAACRAP